MQKQVFSRCGSYDKGAVFNVTAEYSVPFLFFCLMGDEGGVVDEVPES